MITVRHLVASMAVLMGTTAMTQAGRALPLLALANQAQQPVSPEQAAIAALEREYRAAMMEYQKPLIDAKTAEERAAVKLDPAKHPARDFYPKFKSLAQKYGKSKPGFNAWVWTRTTAQGMGDTAAADEALKVILRDFINTDEFAGYVPRLVQYVPGHSGDEVKKQMEDMLARIERESTNPEVLAAVMSRRAAQVGADPAATLAMNRQIVAKYPNTAAGKRAKAAIFEEENLTVGKVAPDFESEDIDGKKFKLSDYRGKVVVLEFWGFW